MLGTSYGLRRTARRRKTEQTANPAAICEVIVPYISTAYHHTIPQYRSTTYRVASYPMSVNPCCTSVPQIGYHPRGTVCYDTTAYVALRRQSLRYGHNM
eukprot:111786-Rhodomonas_salina.1